MSIRVAVRQAEDCSVEVEELTSVEGAAMLNSLTQSQFGMSATEFRQAVEAGKFADTEDAAVTSASMLLPFAQ